MPKRVGNIYNRMDDPAFIRRCIAIGVKDSRKKRRSDVKRVLRNIDGAVEKMLTIVRERYFHPKKPKRKTIYDQSSEKYRDTQSVPFFPDGLMHIMVVQAMMDVLMRGMCHWSCSSIPGRGGKRVHNRIQNAMRNDPKGTKNAAEVDVKSYYASILLRLMMNAYERKIKDKEFLLLLAMIHTCYDDSLANVKSQGLSWKDIVKDECGLQIGFYICQWSANYFLEPLDHFIESLPGVKYMTRHMDNITLLGPNKKELHRAVELIKAFMRDRLGLTMKESWQVYRTTFTAKTEKKRRLLSEKQKRLQKPRMVSAVGYRFAHSHTVMRKRNFLRFVRQCRRVKKRLDAGKPISFKMASGLLSRIGQLKHCNGHSVRQKYVDPIGIKNLKEVVRHESKRRLATQRSLYAGGAA